MWHPKFLEHHCTIVEGLTCLQDAPWWDPLDTMDVLWDWASLPLGHPYVSHLMLKVQWQRNHFLCCDPLLVLSHCRPTKQSQTTTKQVKPTFEMHQLGVISLIYGLKVGLFRLRSYLEAKQIFFTQNKKIWTMVYLQSFEHFLIRQLLLPPVQE